MARRERKIVSVLFADLVGFTARSEELDPEDVEAILRPYHARLRGELERHGGTVEKFIGDAVMALFLPDEALTRMWAAEELLAAGSRAEAEQQLELALAFWRSVGATRYVARADALRAQAATG